MRINKDNNFEEKGVCRFGPGGDFIWHWPGEELPVIAQPFSNKLSEVLARLREIISGVVCSENSRDSASGRTGRTFHSVQRRKINYGLRGDGESKQLDAQAGAVAQGNITLPSGQLLFSDDWGAGKVAGNKPKHRVRAYRRPSKKRPSYELLGQGTLFGADLKGTAVA